MTKADETAFVKAFWFMVEAYGERGIKQARVDAYFHALEDFPIHVVERALAHAIKAVSHFPKPAEIRALVRELRPSRPTRALPPPRDTANGTHAKAAFALCMEIVTTHMGAAQRAERFADMARRWPGVGWEEAEIVARMQVETAEETA